MEITNEKICKLLIDKKLSNLFEIRELLYDYQTNNEDINYLLKKILDYFLNNQLLNENKKIKLVSLIANTSHNLNNSYKEIVHIENLF